MPHSLGAGGVRQHAPGTSESASPTRAESGAERTAGSGSPVVTARSPSEAPERTATESERRGERREARKPEDAGVPTSPAQYRERRLGTETRSTRTVFTCFFSFFNNTLYIFFIFLNRTNGEGSPNLGRRYQNAYNFNQAARCQC